MFNSEYLRACHDAYASTDIDKRISPTETMFNPWYFSVGRSAVEVVLAACAASWVTDVRRVLDVPCGHGRVLRHLTKLFPGAQFDACDLDEDGVRFCAETFGARPVVSNPDLSAVDFGAKYDIIWVGSLFTHTPQHVTQRWLEHLAKFVTEKGLVIATFHGRWSEHVHKVHPYISEESWKSIRSQYDQGGYGYCDYKGTEGHEYIESGYGISLSKPSTIIRMIEAIPGVRLFSYSERCWADHQDVVVFGKPSVDQPWS
jgi:SAM-dependent methyltransferase